MINNKHIFINYDGKKLSEVTADTEISSLNFSRKLHVITLRCALQYDKNKLICLRFGLFSTRPKSLHVAKFVSY